jgi:outer membrane protein
MYTSFRHLAVAVVFLAAAPAAFAQQKLGVVDYRRLLQEAPQGRDAMQALQNEFGPRQKQLEAMQKDLETRAQKFQRDQATMSAEEKTRADRELGEAQRNLERKGKELQEDAELRRQEELQKVQRAIYEEVQKVARAGGYELVLADGVIYRIDSIDITPQVLTSLKAKATAAPTAAVPPAKPAAGGSR